MTGLPAPRGSHSTDLLHALRAPVHRFSPSTPSSADPLGDEDVQLSLYLCYELHYRGLPGVSDEWEWEPTLLAFRRELEQLFETALREVVTVPAVPPVAGDTDVALRQLIESDEGPSLSRFLERDGSEDQLREFLVHRSAYQLKEADPHSWALPRLSGRPKAALVEIQADEYGNGDASRIHAQLFADAMSALGLDESYGAYVDRIPAVTLATVNLMSLCGLHRRLLGAIVGHLALFEMTSSVANRRYAAALRRLGHGGAATAFFDEHVEADAVHESIAAVDLAGGLVDQRPDLAHDVLWGAAALVELERRWAAHVLESWERDRSSLRSGLELMATAGA